MELANTAGMRSRFTPTVPGARPLRRRHGPQSVRPTIRAACRRRCPQPTGAPSPRRLARSRRSASTAPCYPTGFTGAPLAAPGRHLPRRAGYFTRIQLHQGLTTPAGSTRLSVIARRPTSRSSIMRPEANLVRRTGGAAAGTIGRATGSYCADGAAVPVCRRAAALRLPTLVWTPGDPPSERGSDSAAPLRTGETNHIRHHQPQEPTVRDSREGHFRDVVEVRTVPHSVLE